jgi:hypothetical protein
MFDVGCSELGPFTFRASHSPPGRGEGWVTPRFNAPTLRRSHSHPQPSSSVSRNPLPNINSAISRAYAKKQGATLVEAYPVDKPARSNDEYM